MNLQLIATIIGVVSVVGLPPLAGARGRAWTVPVWMFLALPCAACFAWSLGIFVAYGKSSPIGSQPAVGGFAALEALFAVCSLVVFDLIAVAVLLLVPPQRAWTRQSVSVGFVAAIVSSAWCLFLSSLEPKAVALTPYDTFTITVPDGFEGRVWIFEDKAAGVPPQWWLGSAYYTVPANGVLVTKDAGPMRGSKLHSTFRGVRVRNASGVTIPHLHRAHRTTSAPSYHSERFGKYIELVFGDAVPLRDLCEQANAHTFIASQVWWPNRPEVMFCPAECRVNGRDVTWHAVTANSNSFKFQASWSAADNPATRLEFQFSVPGPPQRRAKIVTLSVRNVGAEAVDGWSLEFYSHFMFSLNGKYSYYTEAVGTENRVPFVPLVPEPVARHTFFRVPGARPLQPGEQEAFQFELKRGLVDITPTLNWANSLSPTVAP